MLQFGLPNEPTTSEELDKYFGYEPYNPEVDDKKYPNNYTIYMYRITNILEEHSFDNYIFSTNRKYFKDFGKSELDEIYDEAQLKPNQNKLYNLMSKYPRDTFEIYRMSVLKVRNLDEQKILTYIYIKLSESKLNLNEEGKIDIESIYSIGINIDDDENDTETINNEIQTQKLDDDIIIPDYVKGFFSCIFEIKYKPTNDIFVGSTHGKLFEKFDELIEEAESYPTKNKLFELLAYKPIKDFEIRRLEYRWFPTIETEQFYLYNCIRTSNAKLNLKSLS